MSKINKIKSLERQVSALIRDLEVIKSRLSALEWNELSQQEKDQVRAHRRAIEHVLHGGKPCGK